MNGDDSTDELTNSSTPEPRRVYESPRIEEEEVFERRALQACDTKDEFCAPLTS